MIMSNYLIKKHPEFVNGLEKKSLLGTELEVIQLHKETETSHMQKIESDGIKTGYLAVERYSLVINREKR